MTLSVDTPLCERETPLTSSDIFLEGVFRPHPKGFGFVSPFLAGPDIFISPSQHGNALPGEHVSVLAQPVDDQGRQSGQIIAILSPKLPQVMGRIIRTPQQILLAPLDPAWPSVLLEACDVPTGEMVQCDITSRGKGNRPPRGRVVKQMGSYWTAQTVRNAAIHNHAIPHVFSEEAMAEAARIPDTVSDETWKEHGRVDLRTLPLVTIDGEGSRDFDDAVFAERRPDGSFRLVVAIADVAHYLKEGSELDKDALERATSLYLPGTVIPMLPESISNGICSLNPNVDRLCVVCDTVVTARGELGEARFYNAVMRSFARLTYDTLGPALAGKTALPAPRECEASLTALHALFEAFTQARIRRGALSFDTMDVSLVLGEDGQTTDIVPQVRNDAHRLVEECMVAANVQAARWLLAHGEPGPFRTHEIPEERRYREAEAMLSFHGVALPARETLTAEILKTLIASLENHPESRALTDIVLRMQGKANYDPVNKGHFGLGLEAYTHFTSPIRRYPDVLVHRAIKRTLEGQSPETMDRMVEVCDTCSSRERRALVAEREAIGRHQMAWLARQPEKVLTGRVAGLKSHGAFIVLDESQASGLLPVSELPGKDYVYNGTRGALVSATHTLTLGSLVKVKVAQACPDRVKLLLTWAN